MSFKPRKTWALVLKSGRVIHVCDRKKYLTYIARPDKGDRVERAIIRPARP